jgi:hypothetical protein
MSIESINAMGDCVAVCQRAARRLNYLADAFEAVGNERIADELSAIGEEIVAAALTAQGAQSKALNDDLRQSEQFTGEILSALLSRSVAAPKKEVKP